MASKKEFVGMVCVDSGMVSVGDPCYYSNESNPYSNWSEFCDEVEKTPNLVLSDKGSDWNRSIAFSTLSGDGVYPVYVNKNSSGDITRIIIEVF